MIVAFILGYLAIAFEDLLKINKSAVALLTGVVCWVLYVFTGSTEMHTVTHQLAEHTGDVAQILFFLLGAMVVVELMDAHDCFELVTARIRTTSRRRLLWMVCLITFFLSAVLDNLTTTIVMVSLLRKLLADREDRLVFAGLIVVAANAGGAWSPMGDVTTTMLWIGGQVTAANIVVKLFIPSVVALAVPLSLLSLRMGGQVQIPGRDAEAPTHKVSSSREQQWVFAIGLGSLLFIPVFKTFTHLPPFMGMLFGLGLMWVLTEIIHAGKDEVEKGPRSVVHALRKVDTPSILFFLGILLAVSSLQSAGYLTALAGWLDRTVANTGVIVTLLGVLSAVVDNVPLVAAAQGMYSLEQYPADSFLWEFIAYATGTGGSMLIIGSAAGVAAMGMEQIGFGWYLRRIAPWAALGYLAGALVYVALN